MHQLHYYMERGNQGDAASALTAARLMMLEQYSDLIVQHQLSQAAALGSVDAMRLLGFLGMSGRLLSPASTVAHSVFEQTHEAGTSWLRRAAALGDTISVCALEHLGIPCENTDMPRLPLPDTTATLLSMMDTLLSACAPKKGNDAAAV